MGSHVTTKIITAEELSPFNSSARTCRLWLITKGSRGRSISLSLLPPMERPLLLNMAYSADAISGDNVLKSLDSGPAVSINCRFYVVERGSKALGELVVREIVNYEVVAIV